MPGINLPFEPLFHLFNEFAQQRQTQHGGQQTKTQRWNGNDGINKQNRTTNGSAAQGLLKRRTMRLIIP